MSIVKKRKKADKSPKRPGKNILTNDFTGRQVPGKVVIVSGDNIETPTLVEIVPNYTKCSSCKMFLGKKEEDLAEVLDYNCIECFEIQVEEEHSANSTLVSLMQVSKSKGRKK